MPDFTDIATQERWDHEQINAALRSFIDTKGLNEELGQYAWANYTKAGERARLVKTIEPGSLTDTVLSAAAGLWVGSEVPSTVGHSEYLRGQVETIIDSFGNHIFAEQDIDGDTQKAIVRDILEERRRKIEGR